MASSFFWSGLVYTKQRLEAIPLVPPIKIRKKPVLLQEDPVPVIFLSPGKEKVTMEAFDKVVEYTYDIHVTIIRPGNRIYESDVESFLELREDIRNALYQPNLPGTEFIDANIELAPPFDIVSGEANNYDISGIIIRYKSIEERVS